jgi:hypothetical protein
VSKGFVILAEGIEYSKQAYLCALSIKMHNNLPICIITDQDINDDIFDYVISIDATDDRFRTDNRCKIYELSPFEETIVLDSDTLVLETINWENYSQQDIFYTNTIFSFRGDIIIDRFYRKTFIQNNLPNLYNAFYYFKKSSTAENFYNMQKQVNENWKEVYEEVCQFSTPKNPSMDVNAALTAMFTETYFRTTKEPRLVHMKPMIQGWENSPNYWQEKVGVYVTDNCEVFIGNYKQAGIFHYTENNFVTDKIIGKFEKCLNS